MTSLHLPADHHGVEDVKLLLLLVLPICAQGEYIAVEKLEAIYKKGPSIEQVRALYICIYVYIYVARYICCQVRALWQSTHKPGRWCNDFAFKMTHVWTSGTCPPIMGGHLSTHKVVTAFMQN
jgi:hypothetical protein